MKKKYQKNFQPCPKCERIMSTRAKTCCFCAGKGRGSSAKRKTVERHCKQCGAPFDIPAWRARQAGRGRFCSLECADAFKKTLVGVKSPKWKGGTATRFGSRSTAWKVARLWASAREGGKCQRCHKAVEGFDAIIHHVKPYAACESYIDAFGPHNIMFLCRSCHGKIERLGRTTTKKGQYTRG